MSAARYTERHEHLNAHSDKHLNDVEHFIADVMGAVRSLEYGAVTISVKGGQVVGLERSEKRRLGKPSP